MLVHARMRRMWFVVAVHAADMRLSLSQFISFYLNATAEVWAALGVPKGLEAALGWPRGLEATLGCLGTEVCFHAMTAQTCIRRTRQR